MNAFLLLVSLFASGTPSDDSSFYGIQFQNIGRVSMNTSSLKGKKVVIVVTAFGNKALSTINYLDSIQRANPNVQVLAVPTADFGGNLDTGDLTKLQKKLKLVITEPLNVKRSRGDQQHPFFSWLTRVTGNKHFESDADEEGKTFIISAGGTLYSVLTSKTPLSVLNAVINQDFKE